MRTMRNIRYWKISKDEKKKKIAAKRIIIIIIPVDYRDGSREFTISRERNAAKKEVLI